jgi:MFS family permease
VARSPEGLSYIVHEPVVRTLIALVGATSCFGISFATLFPAWAVRILGGDATTTGLLQSARGLGALLGALLIASLGRFQFKGRLLTVGTFAFPLLLILMTFTNRLWLTLAILVASGLAVILIMNLANALVQTLTPDALRGRVMAVYSMVFFGMMPVGALWVGVVAERVGRSGGSDQWGAGSAGCRRSDFCRRAANSGVAVMLNVRRSTFVICAFVSISVVPSMTKP